jgi:hypothetical protein
MIFRLRDHPGRRVDQREEQVAEDRPGTRRPRRTTADCRGGHHVDPSAPGNFDQTGRERRGRLCRSGYLGWSQLLYCQSSPSEN